MNITKDLLRSWSACANGFKYFLEHWKDGASYSVIQTQLRKDQKYDWAAWLTNKVWGATLKDPAQIAALVKSEVDEAIESTKGSPNSASGDNSKSASSGNYSKSASSGDGSTSASSGKDTIAMVAGLNGKAKAGENGCIALGWDDGKRNRIVTGYVGENIKADTWYGVGDDGALVEIE